MLDLETLSTRSNAAILSIGACIFGDAPKTPQIPFHAYLELEPQFRQGAAFDPSTLMWWLGQSHEARNAQIRAPRMNPTDTLIHFAEWFKFSGAETVWSNGADFDIPIITEAFKRHGATVPWKYNAGRDVRTLFFLVGQKLGYFGTPNVLAHDALADAQFQAHEVTQALTHLELTADKAWKYEELSK